MVTVSPRPGEGYLISSCHLVLRPSQLFGFLTAIACLWYFLLLHRHFGDESSSPVLDTITSLAEEERAIIPKQQQQSPNHQRQHFNNNEADFDHTIDDVQPVKKEVATTKTRRAQHHKNNNNNNMPIKEVAKKKNNDGEESITIGYFISITKCPDSSSSSSNNKKVTNEIAEGAAIVKHSIHLSSIHGELGGKYDYKMHAIVHPEAMGCIQPLEQLGYQIEQRDTPVNVEDIKGKFLREKIRTNGCCGEKELIKLEAYTFTQYPIVVHLDIDTLVLKPLDDLFDAMIYGDETTYNKIERMWPKEPLPTKQKNQQINAMFTRDFGMVKGTRKYKPVQGGFLVLRPDQAVYNEYVEIIKEGDFREFYGWGGLRVGPFYGSMTIQGILPYYYDVLHPGQSLDLNRCVYDQMCDNPRDQKTVNDVVHGNCRTGEVDCEDCRSRPLEDIVSVHFTLCQKPWNCLPHHQDVIQKRLCRKINHEWYRIRSNLEKSWGRSGIGPGHQWKQGEYFFGFCKAVGKKGYVPIATPYGEEAEYN